jgi:flagellar L-ring protein precursor FlgH
MPRFNDTSVRVGLNAVAFLVLVELTCAQSAPPGAASDGTATSSLMVTTPLPPPAPDKRETPSALREVSLFALPPIEPRKFEQHDLVQIIVRETSKAVSSQELETKKNFDLDGQVSNWNDVLSLLTMGIHPSNDSPIAQVNFSVDKDFKGEGDYERKDDLTARLTAEVIDVLPNGNLVLEARTEIQNDEEHTVMKVTGICRGADVTAANTVMSNQINDLKIEKMNTGELRKAGEKGIIAKVLDILFAF